MVQDDFKMDANHFQVIPSLAINLMVKMNEMKLELVNGLKGVCVWSIYIISIPTPAKCK